MPVSSLYLALLAALLVVLSWRVMKLRRRLRIPLGEGKGEDWLFRQTRTAHQNTLENTLLTLLLLFALEGLGAPALLLHALGLVFLGGRIAYVYGLATSPYGSRGRVVGMATAWGVQLAGALLLLGFALAALAA